MLMRSLFVSAVIVLGYFVLPFDRAFGADTLVQLTLGLVVVAALLAWQIRAIMRSAYPTVQGIGTLMVTVPLFLVVFATTYYLMGDADPRWFSESMTRLDALYFTVTVFATVGFGDITAVSETARAVTTVQMVGDVVLVGLVARVVLGAVQEARTRQNADGSR